MTPAFQKCLCKPAAVRQFWAGRPNAEAELLLVSQKSWGDYFYCSKVLEGVFWQKEVGINAFYSSVCSRFITPLCSTPVSDSALIWLPSLTCRSCSEDLLRSRESSHRSLTICCAALGEEKSVCSAWTLLFEFLLPRLWALASAFVCEDTCVFLRVCVCVCTKKPSRNRGLGGWATSNGLS